MVIDMYDSIAKLKAINSVTHDTEGNETIVYTDTTVCVMPRGVYIAEFYNAAQLGLKPSLTLYLTNKEDYNGQKVLSYEGKEYNVIRVDWSAQRDGISLVCEERINGRDSNGSDG